MLKRLSIAIVCLTTVSANSQEHCIEGRYSSIPCFDHTTTSYLMDVKYGFDIGNMLPCVDLYMDIFYPSTTVDTLEKRPLLLFVPGGGFKTAYKEGFQNEARKLAWRGFVTATIDYRAGWSSYGPPSDCEGNGSSLVKAIYRGAQDIHAAIRFLVEYSDSLKIDTDQIYIVSESAGSIAAMSMHYLGTHGFNELYPTLDLNGLYGDMEEAVNSSPATFEIAGMISFWGGIIDSDYMTADKSVPTLFMHGLQDGIIAYEEDNFYDCWNYPDLEGSKIMSEKLDEFGECYELNIDTDGGHGVYNADYHISRIHQFVKKQLCEDCDQETVVNQNGEQMEGLTSLEEIELSVEIYPNPASDWLYISSQESQLQIEFVSLDGRKIQKEIPGETKIDLTDFSSGMYMVNITNESGQIHRSNFVKN